MGIAAISPPSLTTSYEAERRTAEVTAPQAQRMPERLQWRAKARHDLADHLQVDGPLACRHEDGSWIVVYLGRYGLHGYSNTRTLAGPFERLSEAKDAAALIVATAKARRRA